MSSSSIGMTALKATRRWVCEIFDRSNSIRAPRADQTQRSRLIKRTQSNLRAAIDGPLTNLLITFSDGMFPPLWVR